MPLVAFTNIALGAAVVCIASLGEFDPMCVVAGIAAVTLWSESRDEESESDVVS